MRQGSRIQEDYTDPRYMKGDSEIPELRTSTDDEGGTLDYELLPIAADYPTFTGGTFLHPEYLPEVREARLQGGRFIHPEYLPAGA